MKIVHILPALTKGGAEKVVVDLANATSLLGHDVTVLVGYSVDPTLLRNSLLNTVKFQSIYKRKFSKLFIYFLLIPWIFKNWRWISKFDVLHCHLTMGSIFGSIVYLIRYLFSSSKIIVVETNHSVGMPLKIVQSSLSRIQIKFRDGYIIMAENKEWLNILRQKRKLLTNFIPNGVAILPKFDDYVEKNLFKNQIGMEDESVKIIGNIGRLVVDRRPLILLEIFNEIRNKLSNTVDVHFLMGGEGPEKSKIEERVRAYGIEDKIYLPGLIYNPQVAMSTMHLYISVNVGNITGIAGIEAASQGVPVIALQMSQDYVPTPLDWIWSSKDTVTVAIKAIELLKNDSLRLKISEEQKRYVNENLSANIMAKNYEKFYLDVIKNTNFT